MAGIDLMEHNAAFAAYFSSVLAATPWDGFFWECPPISNALLQRPFESVLLPGTFADADPSPFEQHLSKCGRSTGATHFLSLGGDAVLVAPCERGPRTRYGHLCAFVRHAEAAQQQSSGARLRRLSVPPCSSAGSTLSRGSTRRAQAFHGSMCALILGQSTITTARTRRGRNDSVRRTWHGSCTAARV